MSQRGMTMRMIIGDSPPEDYESFMLETMELLSKGKVKSLAIVAFTDEDVKTAYWKMQCMDKAYAAVNIQSDYIDELIMVNRDRYLGYNNESEDNDNG